MSLYERMPEEPESCCDEPLYQAGYVEELIEWLDHEHEWLDSELRADIEFAARR